MKTLLNLTFLFLAVHITASAQDKILFDFEKGTLEGWTFSGENPFFGKNPVHKNLVSKWMRGPVGFLGNYYLESGANEGRHENNPDGILISPEFKITKNHINFLLAGELNPYVKVYLTVNGKEVRQAYGNNSYDLQLRGWDVSEFKGKTARFCIKDSSQLRSLLRVDHIVHTDKKAPAPETWVRFPGREESSLVRPGEFKLAFADKSIEQNWYMNHHTILYGADNKWHIYASAWPADALWKDNSKKFIVHATAPVLDGPWKYEGIVLEADPDWGEQFLAHPEVVFHNGKYYMFYKGSGNHFTGFYTPPSGKPNPWHLGNSGDIGPFNIHIALSNDGYNWERYTEPGFRRKGVIFTDKPFAETPSVIKTDTAWIMYYGSASGETVYDKHAIGYRSSRDLIHWSARQIALKDWSKGDMDAPEGLKAPASPWPEHTFFRYPQVFRRGDTWYLLAGPISNSNLGRYHCSLIFTSQSPFLWTNHNEAFHKNKRLFIDGGGRIFRDNAGKWYVSTGNEMSGGIWIAPLHWNDGNDEKETSVPVAGK